jgi:hypothetical protein
MYLKVIFQICSSDPFFLHTITSCTYICSWNLRLKAVI